jgi:hypothetical protein
MTMTIFTPPPAQQVVLFGRLRQHIANCAAYKTMYLRERPALPPLRLQHLLGLAPLPGMRG